MDKTITAIDQLDSALSHYHKRAKETGDIIWQRLFKKKVAEVKHNQNAIYSELMKLESDAKTTGSEKLLNRIYKLKGMLSILCLSLICFNVGFKCIRPVCRIGSHGILIKRVIRKREGVQSWG